jgi:TetR/AcrR family transcriptional regulator, cholesterol catabolism regulator
MTGVDRSAPHAPDVRGQRRIRIIETASTLAAEGGYDAVQMRTIAHRTPVALATLYRHFPSKTHLLVAVLSTELERVQDRLDRQIVRGASPYDRLMRIVALLTRSMQRAPRLTEATTRALMFADASAAGEVDAVRALIDEQFARAMSIGEPNPEQLAVGGVIGDLWLAALAAWVSHRVTADEVVDRLALAIGLVLGHRPAGELF